jgi:hypothetical protein
MLTKFGWVQNFDCHSNASEKGNKDEKNFVLSMNVVLQSRNVKELDCCGKNKPLCGIVRYFEKSHFKQNQIFM